MLDPETSAGIGQAVSAAGGMVVKNTLNSLETFLRQKAPRIAKATIDALAVDLRIGFSDYLNLSYERCRLFKTILNPNQPLDLVSNYVHVSLTCGSEKLDDDELITELAKRKHIVVVGLAGSGKSMFMKYATICKFENPVNGVPLFVDLRKINPLSEKNLLTYIRTSCSNPTSNITKERFDLALKCGAFSLFLDGFDEIDYEARDEIQKQLLEIKGRFSKVSIVVSSRPDDRFGSWLSFYVFEVDRLSKKQTLSLIRGFDYDAGVKKRFAQEVTSRLYDSHTSFMSSPLLTTIMLLTYEEFAEIPDKMHMFYSQAFDTLYQKHDAQKEQFQRKTRTGLTREDFKSCFSAFCAMSYLEQNYSFNDATLEETARNAVNYSKQTGKAFAKVTPKQLIDDLRESVCMLQPDGLEFTFVHRSFQEYFAALFVTNVHGSTAKKIIDRYALRFGDSVLPMALDMDRETIEKEWVLPKIAELEEALCLSDRQANSAVKFSKLFPKVILFFLNRRLHLSVRNGDKSVIGPFQALCFMYPKVLEIGVAVNFLDGYTAEGAADLWLKEEHSGKHNFEKIKALIDSELAAKGPGRPIREFHIQTEDDWWLNAAGANQAFIKIQQSLDKIRRDIVTRQKKRLDILGVFFNSETRP